MTPERKEWTAEAYEAGRCPSSAYIEGWNDALDASEAMIADRDRSIDAMTARIASLQHQHEADAARIAGLEAEANRRIVERDARIDEVAAEAHAERSKRERIEAAANDVLALRDRYGVITITGQWKRADAAINALRTVLGGGR